MKAIITREEMEAAGGYKILCGPFSNQERSEFDSAVADMERGKIDYVLVGKPGSVSVARRGMKTIREESLTQF